MDMQQKQQDFAQLAGRTPDPLTGRLPLGRPKFSDLPVVELDDLYYISASSQLDYGNGPHTKARTPFEAACETGPVSLLRDALAAHSAQRQPTPAFLHHGLVLALAAGNAETAEALLEAGAPIVRETAGVVLAVDDKDIVLDVADEKDAAHPDTAEASAATVRKQIALLQLLLRHSWSPDTAGHYGATLLPQTASSRRRLPILRWLLAEAHADPDLGPELVTGVFDQPARRTGGPLAIAAGRGNLEAVKLLLAAGAHATIGEPLYFAAGAAPPGSNTEAPPVRPSRAFDESRIPIMELLVEAGADANKNHHSLHAIPEYPIVNAVRAGALQRVRFLLAHGADPRRVPRCAFRYGNALQEAQKHGSPEMRQVLAEWERDHAEQVEGNR